MLRFQRNIQILTGREKAETVNDILENDSMGENCSKFYMYSRTGQMSRVSSNGWKFTNYIIEKRMYIIKIIRASEVGAKLDSNVYTGGGTDDTAVFRGMISSH